ncbi:MAG: glycoside hydrolase family 9 protein, partial [Phycicoccus sp.]
MTPARHPLDVARARPPVRVNQLGYPAGLPLVATVVTDARSPLPWWLLDRGGRVLAEGRSTPWPERPDPTSGENVHVVRLDRAPDAGPGCLLDVGGARSHPFTTGTPPYDALAHDALRFLTLQRSGVDLPAEEWGVHARPAGHVGVSPNRGDTAVGGWTGPDAARLYPGWRPTGRHDVSGGWYDAGDHGKYATSGSIALWQLLLVLDTPALPQSFRRAVVDECRWQLDWLLRMQVPAPDPLAGTVFHRVHGTSWSPLPGLPHEDPTERVLHRPSTPATLHLAAVGATAARVLGTEDPPTAARALRAARAAFEAAQRHPHLVPPDDHARHGGGPYGDDDASDDLYWAAAELWLATGEDAYRDIVLGSPWHHADAFSLDGFDFDRVAGPARLDLAVHGGDLPGHVEVAAS